MWIKICGITTAEDAELVADSGADAIGLNFYAGSKRCVDVACAGRISLAAGDRLEVVGVFVNAPADQVIRTVEQFGLNSVQFHGDETPELIAAVRRRLPDVRLIRAIRIGPDGHRTVTTVLESLQQQGVRPDAILVDACVPGQYGGTGQQVSAVGLQPADRSDWPPLILAGGLNPDNVAAAAQQLQPWGVDTASGVELSPGHKCPDKVRRFVQALRQLEPAP